MQYDISPVEEADHSVLTQIAHAAKRHWNYPEEWIQLWKDDLTITPQYASQHTLLKATSENQILGFIALQAELKEIEHCWILPAAMGHGIGRKLVDAIKLEAVKLGIQKLTVVSDPYAQGFYEKQGGVVVNQWESTPKGRFLPILEIAL